MAQERAVDTIENFLERQVKTVFSARACSHLLTHALNLHTGECWLEVATEMINNHLQLFRTLPWVMGGVGMLLIVKYSRLVSGTM